MELKNNGYEATLSTAGTPHASARNLTLSASYCGQGTGWLTATAGIVDWGAPVCAMRVIGSRVKPHGMNNRWFLGKITTTKNMTNDKDLQFAKTLATYKGKWVAFKLEEHRIIASGKKLQEVQEQVEKNNEKDYVFHLVPSRPLAVYAI